MKQETIDTSHFTDAEFMTAGDKRKVLKGWVRFFKSGFDFKHFSKALYDHLIQHCSFIAHYNKAGFHATYFQNPEATQCFLDQFDRSKGCVSVEYGSAYWIHDGNDVCAQMYDVNNAMVDAIAEMLPEIGKQLHRQEFEQAEAELEAAQDKIDALLAGQKDFPPPVHPQETRKPCNALLFE